MKTILLFILCICLLPKSHGTHLIGSQITYQYLRTLPDSSRQYKFTVNVSRNCETGAVQLPGDFYAGVYNTKTRKRLKILNFTLFEKHINDCYTICVEEGNYLCTTSLPPDSAYYVTVEYCCRTNLQNVRNSQSGDPDQGVMIYCLVPSMINSSPTFSADKILSSQPAMTDTFRFFTQDAEIDSVAVSLITPNTGGSLANNFPSPADTFGGFIPLAPSVYAAGYSGAKPLGASSTMICDPTRKYIVVKCDLEGVYSVAYEVSEFRKGVLIAEYTRESLVYITNNPKSNQKIKLTGQHIVFPNHAQLNWTAPCPSRIRKQYLERSVDDQLHYIIFDSVANTSGLSSDATLVKGHTYFYRVRTAGTDGLQYYSNVWGFNYFDQGLERVNAIPVNISPMPVQDVCQLSVIGSSIRSCTVMDMAGRIVMQIEMPGTANEYSLNCSNLSTGIYTIQILTSDGDYFSRKIVKE